MRQAASGEIWDLHFPKWGRHPGLVFHAGPADCWAALITESAHLERHVSWMLLPGKTDGHEITGLIKESTLKPDKFENIKNDQLISYRGIVDPEVVKHTIYWASKLKKCEQ